MSKKQKTATGCAILAAVLYALNCPFSKLLLQHLPSTMLAGLLYLGAGFGMLMVGFAEKGLKLERGETPLSKKDLPYTIGMVLLDIAAPILLMLGLSMTTSANASLLNNFEIVATSVIALLFFHEKISGKLWIAISFVTVASILLSLNGDSAFSFSLGSVFVLLACVCWGFENNCTRMLSNKNPLQIVVIKGICSGSAAVLIAICMGESFPAVKYVLLALLLGFVSYGLSIFFYIYAQRTLGAAKTSAYYAAAPFAGALLSIFILGEIPNSIFVIALLVMLFGVFFAISDSKKSTPSS